MFPHAERFGASTVTLPLFPSMSADDVAHVVKSIDEICEQFAQEHGHNR